MMIRISAAEVAHHLSPPRRNFCFWDYPCRGIIYLAAGHPEHWIGAKAGNNVTPMLFHVGDAHLRNPLPPASYDRRHDPALDQVEETTVRVVEEPRIQAREASIPHRTALITEPLIHW